MFRAATISNCNLYRYNITRKWNLEGDNLVSFIGLNPSTADASKDDPTLLRCINFSKSLGFDGMILVNLFAYRSTSPKAMKEFINPIGEENDAYIIDAIMQTNKTILCWGNHGVHKSRDIEIHNLIRTYRELNFCFGKTLSNQPRHPLYLSRNTPLERFYLAEL
ncbi:MAG: DUF1643 domain-containing protein [Psychrobacter sp.]|jgi:hypothetical protein